PRSVKRLRTWVGTMAATCGWTFVGPGNDANRIQTLAQELVGLRPDRHHPVKLARGDRCPPAGDADDFDRLCERCRPKRVAIMFKPDTSAASHFMPSLEAAARSLVASKSRQRELPDVPTLMEIGLDGFPLETWTGILVPNGTPREIIDTLNMAVNAALRTPAMTASLSKLGFHTEPASAKDFADLVTMDAKRWAEVVRLTGVKID